MREYSHETSPTTGRFYLRGFRCDDCSTFLKASPKQAGAAGWTTYGTQDLQSRTIITNDYCPACTEQRARR